MPTQKSGLSKEAKELVKMVLNYLSLYVTENRYNQEFQNFFDMALRCAKEGDRDRAQVEMRFAEQARIKKPLTSVQ